MLDKSYLLPSEALGRIVDAIPENRLSVERLKIEECYGRIAASDLISSEYLPAFSRTTVDGFAVSAADTFGAKDSSPAYLTLKNEVKMGAAPDFRLNRGEAARYRQGACSRPAPMQR